MHRQFYYRGGTRAGGRRYIAYLRWPPARNGLVAERARLDDKHGQHGIPDDHERIRQRARRTAARPAGWRRVEPRHCRHRRHGEHEHGHLVSRAVTGTQTCHTTIRQDYWGTQVGRDISILNHGGSGVNWHVGVMAGYFAVKSKDITPAGSYFKLPLVYRAFPLYTELQYASGILHRRYRGAVCGDVYCHHEGRLLLRRSGPLGFLPEHSFRYEQWPQRPEPRRAWLFGDRQRRPPDPSRLRLVHRAFGGRRVVPGEGRPASRARPAAGCPPSPPPVRYARGAVFVDDIESVLGRATIRVGTNFTSGGVAWQPFVTASVFHEFAGDVTATSVALLMSSSTASHCVEVDGRRRHLWPVRRRNRVPSSQHRLARLRSRRLSDWREYRGHQRQRRAALSVHARCSTAWQCQGSGAVCNASV